MVLLKLFCSILFSLSFSSCAYIGNLFENTKSVNSRASSIKDISVNFGTEYSLLLVSDVHFESNYERPEKLFSTLDKMETKPEACFVLGDITRNCTVNEFNSYLEFCQDLKTSGISEIYAVPGNHDCDDGGDLFISKVHPNKTYFRLLTDNFSFYFLDSSEGSFGDSQIENFSQIISSDSKKKIVFSHYPLYVPESFNDKLNKASERALMISLLGKNGALYYFCGHTHEYYSADFGKFCEIVLGDLKWSGKFGILHINEFDGTISFDYK